MLLTMHPQTPGKIRVASPGRDHSALSALMSDYLRWALGQLKSEYGITDMPVDRTDDFDHADEECTDPERLERSGTWRR